MHFYSVSSSPSPSPSKVELLENGQCSCGDALSNSLEMIICRVELDVAILRELCHQDLLRHIQYEVSTSALAHTAKDHDVIDVVEFTVLSQAIAQVYTYGLIKLSHLRLLCWVGHCLLDQLQAPSMVFVFDCAHVWVRIDVVLWQYDASLRGKLGGTALAQIHVGDATMVTLGPWVRWCFRVHVQLYVTHLIDPTIQVAILVCIATTLAAAHGDTEDVALANLLHRSKCCYLTIVNDLERHISGHFLSNPYEDVHDLGLVHIWGD